MAPLILLVENEPEFQKYYGGALADAGYKVVLMQRGHEAAAIATQLQPELVLLNLSTLSMVEVDIVPRFKLSRTHESLPVVAYSILSENDDIQRALRLGADDYFVHSRTSAPEMLKKVSYHLALKAQMRQQHLL